MTEAPTAELAMKSRWMWMAALALLVAAACSRKDDGSEAVKAPAPAPPPAEDPETPPAPSADVDVAATDIGGAVEELTGNYGPGYRGRSLVNGLLAPTWRIEAASSVVIAYPEEAVISYYEREPAEMTSAPDQTTTIGLGVDGERFVLMW